MKNLQNQNYSSADCTFRHDVTQNQVCKCAILLLFLLSHFQLSFAHHTHVSEQIRNGFRTVFTFVSHFFFCNWLKCKLRVCCELERSVWGMFWIAESSTSVPEFQNVEKSVVLMVLILECSNQTV